MLPEKIILADLSIDLVHAWAKAFPAHEGLELHKGDFFARSADAIVSPANSFGVMDGGLNAAIRAVLGKRTERRVQDMIVERYHDELPVGTAIVVPTEHKHWAYLVVAPTKRVPERVADTLNAYLAFRAALLAVRDHNTAQLAPPIRTLLVPGLATGMGGMAPGRCAQQMRVAYDEVSKPARIPSTSMIRATHAKLRSAV